MLKSRRSTLHLFRPSVGKPWRVQISGSCFRNTYMIQSSKSSTHAAHSSGGSLYVCARNSSIMSSRCTSSRCLGKSRVSLTYIASTYRDRYMRSVAACAMPFSAEQGYDFLFLQNNGRALLRWPCCVICPNRYRQLDADSIMLSITKPHQCLVILLLLQNVPAASIIPSRYPTIFVSSKRHHVHPHRQ